MVGLVKFHTKYKSSLRWLLITFLMLFITAVITPANFSNIFDKGPVSILAQEWEGGSETTFESGSEPLVEQPKWEGGSETTFESGSEPVSSEPQWESGSETTYESIPEPIHPVEPPSQPQWEPGPETTFESAPEPVYEQPASENPPIPDPYVPPAPPVYETPESPQQVYNPPVYDAPVYTPPVQSPQLSNPQPVVQQTQPQIQQQPVIPVTAEDYQCESGNKVYYWVFINVSRSPERTGRVDYNSPSCTSPAYLSGNNLTQASVSTQNSNNQQQYRLLSVSCYASPASVRVGEGVTWQVLTNGGSGSFRYEWSGDSSVNGQSNSSFYVPSYNSPGHRTVKIEVKDRITDHKVTATCSIQVLSLPTPTPTPTPSNQTSFPTFAPIVIPVVNQPQIQVISNTQSAQCPSGTIEKSRTGTQLICERPSPSVTTVTASNPVQCPSGTIERSRTGSELLCERPIQTITTTQTVVTASPVSSPVTTVITQAGVTAKPVQCPSGTIEKSRTAQELICERQLAQTQQSVTTTTQAESKQPVTVITQDSASSIKELPKTGLPLAAIGFTALTPIGLRLKKIMGKREVSESANDIWMKRQINF